MTLLIEDTARNNLAGWAGEAVTAGLASGAVISPFSTPRQRTTYKQAARDTVDRLVADGAEVWFDPETHALQMPSVGDFRYYDDWPLWDGPRGQLTSHAEMRGHVERVFAAQDGLGAPHLAPTVLLHSPQSPASRQALDLARVAIEVDPSCRLAVAGDAAFWASGITLDAHMGALAQLDPGGWSLTVVRHLNLLPVPAMVEEVHGICRSARSLGEDVPVHISHGDLAGLPAIAAGAATLGTGWDPRQRVSCYASYEARTAGGEGGQWFQQTTLEGLLSLLPRSEASVLEQRSPTLANRLVLGGVPPGPKEAFVHHIGVLARLVADLRGRSHDDAFRALRGRYDAAETDWNAAAGAIGIRARIDAWITPVKDGLSRYGTTEGF